MTSINRNINRARAFIAKAIVEVESEIVRHQNGCGTVGNIEQLAQCQINLQKMDEELKENKLTKTCIGMANAIIDSWPLESKLGDLLIKAEQEYVAACSIK